MKNIHDTPVFGSLVDDKTRCSHYHGPSDIIAILFPCCQRFYPCYKCHEEHSDHPLLKWKKQAFDSKAILCGECGSTLTIHEYVSHSACPTCHASFNPGCKLHYPVYFEWPIETVEE
ncbi:CHY zinc finger protein [Radiobacillus deserti]|uniref:CHY-type domain-containing protein n=1 Tax=Radiobacillus deserti TaxID=2594883 RepID=A0A516KFZ5_9BACI|nr:CHY zinc finger protein [Radiobacillus deserti]QDP40322.1 hypothetical protein FN924_09120 [Radiobacillus deserti]